MFLPGKKLRPYLILFSSLVRGGGRDEDWEAPGAIGGAVAEEPPSSRGVEKPQQPPPAASQLNTNCIAEFPTLGMPSYFIPSTLPSVCQLKFFTNELCRRSSAGTSSDDFGAVSEPEKRLRFREGEESLLDGRLSSLGPRRWRRAQGTADQASQRSDVQSACRTSAVICDDFGDYASQH